MIYDSETRIDSRGRVTKHKTEYIVGVDNPFLNLRSLLGERGIRHPLQVDDLHLDILARSGMLGSVHIVDVSHDDPDQYVFESYGLNCRLEGGSSLTGKRVSRIDWGLMRDHAMRDYQRAKRTGDPELCQVDLEDKQLGLSTVYRRLVLPLTSGHRGEVTHLLVGAVRELQERVANTLQKPVDIGFDGRQDGVRPFEWKASAIHR